MIVLQPVLKIHASDGFALWTVASCGPYGFLPLSGRLGPAEACTAVMSIAACNSTDTDDDSHPPGPAAPFGRFLHGLLTTDELFASGGLQVIDTATGTGLLQRAGREARLA
ncbi:hypothetical protein ACF08B_37500 [Streptomyces sp. NPDC015139]|uniref:hypothetical protein n=1 Tax=Streptomyces sp. NPDC015139 TaxID=3364942 RepID=UPI0036F55077